MRAWLTGVQSGFMRAIGLRKLREALDTTSHAVHADLDAKMDALRADLAELRERLARDGIARGEAEASVQRLLGEYRSEISGLRAAFVQEAEMAERHRQNG